ncbi:hypothetical protein FHS74_000369 [Nitrospirillum iridis]|uniref:Uncharacterized protein n=1 Tax=Nitrospirillum iridis TaxID=765888 RepID=A0A7X0AV31_9PROT|nr:hypothetical protein [Nitrospirillum iridis]
MSHMSWPRMTSFPDALTFPYGPAAADGVRAQSPYRSGDGQ